MYIMEKMKDLIWFNLKIFYHTLFRIISLFTKIDNGLVILSSYNHTQISCNPKYIENYIVENEEDFKVFWILRNPMSKIGKKEARENIVIFKSLNYLIKMSRAKFVISNQRTQFLVPKRKNQIYIQTWHSSVGLKQIEAQAEKYLSKRYIDLAKNDSKKTDYIISGSKFNSNRINKYFWYNGPILEIGTPRNDIFFDEKSERERITANLNIPKGKKIVLYAPTFRQNQAYDYFQLNFKMLTEHLTELTGDQWICISKLHPNVKKMIKDKNDWFYDVSEYKDVQELLMISNCLITDYSSIMFDYVLTKKPIFLFTPDINKYLKSERNFNFELEKLPFSLAKSEDGLFVNIRRFDYTEYLSRVDEFIKQVGYFEDGFASERLISLMKKERDLDEKNY